MEAFNLIRKKIANHCLLPFKKIPKKSFGSEFPTIFRIPIEKTLMVNILAASSVDHALDTLNRESRKNYREKIFSIRGLSVNHYLKNPKKIVQNMLSKGLVEKNDYVIWHDVLNNSVSKHESNNYRALTVPQLLEKLKSIENKPGL